MMSQKTRPPRTLRPLRTPHPVEEVLPLPVPKLALYGFQHALIEIDNIANHRFDDFVADLNPIRSARTQRLALS